MELKLSPCYFGFCQMCFSVSNFCCIYSSPWVINLARLGSADALFSDPSCTVCCLSPGENTTGSLLFYQEEKMAAEHTKRHANKWSGYMIVNQNEVLLPQSSPKNLALLCGQQIKAVTGFIYICWLIGRFLNKIFSMTKSWWKTI